MTATRALLLALGGFLVAFVSFTLVACWQWAVLAGMAALLTALATVTDLVLTAVEHSLPDASGRYTGVER